MSDTNIVGRIAADTGMVSDMMGTANQFVQANGGYGTVAKKAVGSYVDSHGGAAGTAAHLGHDAVSMAANTLVGAKDWGDAYRAAKAGDWKHALSSGLWGLAAVGATASMAIPGAGEVIKGAELGAQAARVGAKEGAELLTKDAVETGTKDVVEGGVKKEVSGVKKAGKMERKAHLASEGIDLLGRVDNFLNGQANAQITAQDLKQPRIY
jgi:hypothetical protein